MGLYLNVLYDSIISTSKCDITLVSTPSPPPVTYCHKKYYPLPPPSERDVIYEWSQKNSYKNDTLFNTQILRVCLKSRVYHALELRLQKISGNFSGNIFFKVWSLLVLRHPFDHLLWTIFMVNTYPG